MRLSLCAPARRIRLSHRSLTGRTATGGSSVSFESALERDWSILLDFDPDVAGFLEQPFTLSYAHEGRQHHYTPDFMAEFGRQTGQSKRVVYEVKYRDELRRDWLEYRPRFQAANRHCRAQGWTFTILTEQEIRTPLLENAKFLRQYPTIRVKPLVRSRLIETLHSLGPTTLEELLTTACAGVHSREETLPTLWSLIATRQVVCDLHQPLMMYSEIRPMVACS
jgi:hypothetical protein